MYVTLSRCTWLHMTQGPFRPTKRSSVKFTYLCVSLDWEVVQNSTLIINIMWVRAYVRVVLCSHILSMSEFPK